MKKRIKEKYYRVTTPSGKKWKEYLNKKQIKNLRIAEFKVRKV